MKMLKLLLSVSILAAVAIGCGSLGPVPKSTYSGKVAGQEFNIQSPKNTAITGLEVTVNTNGTVTMKIASLSSTNDAQVIDKSFAGQAQVIDRLAAANHQAFVDGTAAAGTIAGAAAKAP